MSVTPHWLLGPEGWSLPVCDVDLRPGGKWHYVWRGPGDEKLEMHGEYREVVPPKRLVNTEEWGGEWPSTLNTLELTEENGQTTSKTTVLYQSKQAMDGAIGTGMKEGWAYSYERLDDYLSDL